jgi:hypothetical protein
MSLHNKPINKAVAVIMARLIREPLSVFVLLAGAIFAYDAWFADYSLDEEAAASWATWAAPRSIVVTDAVVDALTENYEWLHGRQPDEAETDLLVQGWIADEVVFREGLNQQMHLTDARVRAQIVNKVRLLWAGVPREPAEHELLAYYMDNIGRYYSEPRVSFEQVFFQREQAHSDQLLARLRSGETVDGDGFWLGDVMEGYGLSILRNNLGMDFYKALVSAPVGLWHGPLTSTRGQHYIKLGAVYDSAPLAYADIRDRVERDWYESQRAMGIAEQTMAVMAGHEIVLEFAQ